MTATKTGNKRYYGVAEAIVVDVNDPEQQGRVQVQFPWFDGDMTSEWCRVCQFYAGADYGALWVPELDQEVLVSFVQGDMRIPVVLGGLYNGQDKPSSFRDDSKDEKVIRTRAGHEIVFNDQSGEEKITIIDKDGKNSIVIDTVANEICITASEGKIKIHGRDGVDITSDQNVTLEAGSGLDATAGASMNLSGATINLNS